MSCIRSTRILQKHCRIQNTSCLSLSAFKYGLC
nr:MAG TPA: hypothetical protein [Caudoviricetes sp.]